MRYAASSAIRRHALPLPVDERLVRERVVAVAVMPRRWTSWHARSKTRVGVDELALYGD